MSKGLLFLCLLLALLVGCSDHKINYGVVSPSGSVSYPLCERSKHRITDMQRISFELPTVFKQAPCRNWPDYSYVFRTDELFVSIPAVIVSGSQASIGGVRSMSFHVGSGPRSREFYLSPEIFFEEKAEYLSKRMQTHRLVAASWVTWRAGRCARFYSENETEIYLLRVLDYFCWESLSGSSFPIHIHATQKLPLGHAPASLDKEMIEPVLDSLEINPVPPERLALWGNESVKFCATLKNNYDARMSVKLQDDLDMRRTIRLLRGCGYEMPDPVGIEKWKDIFHENGHLVGQAVSGDNLLRRVSPARFSELEAKLMSLRPRRGERPDMRISGQSADGKGTVEKFRITGLYDGNWYIFPTSQRHGIGIRNDPVMGRMIEVFLWDGGIPMGLKIVNSIPES